MHWEIIVALVVMVPIVLLPMLAVWYLNFGCPGLDLLPIKQKKQSKE